MKNEEPIFTITTVKGALNSGTRCVGFTHTFKQAEEIVKNNIFDINEMGYYPYVVIEETNSGLYSYPRKETWYVWDGRTNTYEQIPEKPERFKQICGWGIG